MNEASAKSSMAYFLKARTIYNLLGMKDELRGIEPCINMAKVQLTMFGGGRQNALCASALLQNVVLKRDLNAKSEYERNKVSFGLTSEKTMEAGLIYVGALVSAKNAIEQVNSLNWLINNIKNYRFIGNFIIYFLSSLFILIA